MCAHFGREKKICPVETRGGGVGVGGGEEIKRRQEMLKDWKGQLGEVADELKK